jgi:cytochrome c-type biogenesis protein
MSITDFKSLFAFVSGLLSFFSPCVLPLVPSYLIFISGISFEEFTEAGAAVKYRKTVLLHSVAFILGFSFVFVTLGLSSSILGNFFADYQTYIIRLGGIILIVMGFFYLNIIKLPFLNQEKVIHLRKKPLGMAGSFIVGITFSLGWTPCVGPALSSILILASTTDNLLQGVTLLSLYSLGLAIPFIASALVFDHLFALLKRSSRVVKYAMTTMGLLLIIIGLLLVTNYYGVITSRVGALFG